MRRESAARLPTKRDDFTVGGVGVIPDGSKTANVFHDLGSVPEVVLLTPHSNEMAWVEYRDQDKFIAMRSDVLGDLHFEWRGWPGQHVPSSSIFLMRGPTLERRLKDTNELIWSAPMPMSIQFATGTNGDITGMGIDRVFAAHQDDVLRAYAKDDGSLLWETPHPDRIQHCATDLELIWTACIDGRVRTIVQETGEVIDTSPNLVPDVHPSQDLHNVYPSEDRDFLYVAVSSGSSGGTVRKYPFLDWDNPVWSTSRTRARCVYRYAPEGKVYVGGTSGGLQGNRSMLDDETGEVLETISGGASNSWSVCRVDESGVWMLDHQATWSLSRRNHDLSSSPPTGFSGTIGERPRFVFGLDELFVYYCREGGGWARRWKDSLDIDGHWPGPAVNTFQVEPGPAPFFRPF